MGDQNLTAHDVDTGDNFSYGVLYLDAGVHFNEEPFVGVQIVEEFNSAGVVVADGFCNLYGGLAEVVADFVGQADGRGDLNDFLVPPLDRAVALVQVDDVALFVAEDLHFDMLGPLDIALEENGGVAEGALGLALGFFEEMFKILGVFDHAHAAATAAKGCLDDEGEANFLGDFERFCRIGNGIFCSRQGGHFCLIGNFARFDFVPHARKEVGTRTDESDVIGFAGVGKGRIFGEESVSRVDQVDVVVFCKVDDAVDVEVGGDGPFALTDEVGLIGFEAVDAEAVFVGVNGNGATPEFSRAAEDADSDFTAVGGK